jgi:hypothetical protein
MFTSTPTRRDSPLELGVWNVQGGMQPPMSILIVVVMILIGTGALASVKVIRRVLSERRLQHTLGSLQQLGERITNSAPPIETMRPIPARKTLRRSQQPRRAADMAPIDG